MSKPLLIIMSAPSGAGKSTLCDRLLADFDNIVYSVSCTTRDPRGDEEDGVDYFFMTKDAFLERISEGVFLEHAKVHGNYYGTLMETVYSAMTSGESVIMDIDVQGAAQIRSQLDKLPPGNLLREGFIDIFIMPPSIDVLRNRLFGRGEDTPDVIEKRLKNAADEMDCSGEYKYVIVNDDLEIAYRTLRDIVILNAKMEL